MANYAWLTWIFACMLRTYRKHNPLVGHSKYEFNNNLFGGVTFFRFTSGVTWIQHYISKFNLNFDKSTLRLHYLNIFFMLTKFLGDKKLIVMSSINCLNLSFCSSK